MNRMRRFNKSNRVTALFLLGKDRKYRGMVVGKRITSKLHSGIEIKLQMRCSLISQISGKRLNHVNLYSSK